MVGFKKFSVFALLEIVCMRNIRVYGLAKMSRDHKLVPGGPRLTVVTDSRNRILAGDILAERDRSFQQAVRGQANDSGIYYRLAGPQNEDSLLPVLKPTSRLFRAPTDSVYILAEGARDLTQYFQLYAVQASVIVPEVMYKQLASEAFGKLPKLSVR